MNLNLIDWGIFGVFTIFLIAMAINSKRYSRSVADFLAANRCAGRYVMCVSESMMFMAAISTIANFEMYYSDGWRAVWWNLINTPVGVIIALSGWIIYRYRQTRVLTMAQFLEQRYSKKLRIFAGMLAYLSGIINFGIFPAVSARFFMYFMGFPTHIGPVPTLYIIMAVLVGLSLFFVFIGGQVTLIVTDFIQGMFSNIAFVIILIALFVIFDWNQLMEGLRMAPTDASLLHPFQGKDSHNFNIWFFMIWSFGYFYAYMAFQGNMGFNASAKTPHEARMGKILSNWRFLPSILLAVLVPSCAYTMLHHPAFAQQGAAIQQVINSIPEAAIQKQMTTPIALTFMLPHGLIGLFCAMMLAAFIANHNTYLHSWGSIFIQDVVLPLRKKAFETKEHIKYLKLSILGVAIFIYIFSMIFQQTEYIYMYWMITGAIYVGGAGVVIIGGLYWKRGTTTAAWAGFITGSILAVGSIVLQQIWLYVYHKDFPLNGSYLTFIAYMAAIAVYIGLSLLENKVVDMDRLLHRGKYAVAEDTSVGDLSTSRGLKVFGVGKEFTRGDKWIYFSTIAWTLLWTGIFVIGTVYNMIVKVPTESWITFWKWYAWFYLIISIVTTIWISWGGLIDMKEMFRLLRFKGVDERDDGTVIQASDIVADPAEAAGTQK